MKKYRYPETSLFYGISTDRVARLRSIKVGGRPLFDERGEIAAKCERREDPMHDTIETPILSLVSG